MFVLLSLAGMRVVGADEEDRRPKKTYIVLENGRLLQGTLQRDRSDAVIKMENGGVIRLPIHRISVVADSMNQAFQIQQTKLTPRDVNGHVALCEWCLRNRLFGQSGDVLRTLKGLQPENPDIASLERRLKSGIESEKRQANMRKTAAREISPTGDVNHVAAAGPDAVSESTRSTFHHRIMPILINRCAAGGCHGKSGNGVFVQRPPQGQLVSRRLADRNLARVTAFIGDNAGFESDLYKMAISDHTGTGPPLKSNDPASRSLLVWIAQWQRDLGVNTDADAGKAADGENTVGENAVGENAAGKTDQTVQGESAEPSGPAKLKSTQTATPIAGDLPDPYDPAVFNRRVQSK